MDNSEENLKKIINVKYIFALKSTIKNLETLLKIRLRTELPKN